MDTYEARMMIRDLGQRGLNAVEGFRQGAESHTSPVIELRGLQVQARALLADAGYPGEAIWRALNQAYFGFDVYGEPGDSGFWVDVADELRAGIDTLDGLLSPGGLGADFRIVG